MAHLADSRAGVRDCYAICVITLKLEDSLAIFLEVVQSSTLPTGIGPCLIISDVDLVYAAYKTVMDARCTSGELHHLR